MDEYEAWWLGFGAAATIYIACFGVSYGIQKHRERKKLRLQYTQEFGFEPPEDFSLRDIRRDLETREGIHKEV